MNSFYDRTLGRTMQNIAFMLAFKSVGELMCEGHVSDLGKSI